MLRQLLATSLKLTTSEFFVPNYPSLIRRAFGASKLVEALEDFRKGAVSRDESDLKRSLTPNPPGPVSSSHVITSIL